jgi:hypothetical protein
MPYNCFHRHVDTGPDFPPYRLAVSRHGRPAARHGSWSLDGSTLAKRILEPMDIWAEKLTADVELLRVIPR